MKKLLWLSQIILLCCYPLHAILIINGSQQDINLKIGSDCVNVHHMPSQHIPKKSYASMNTLMASPKLCILTQVTQDNENKILITELPNTPDARLEIIEHDSTIFIEYYPH
jgi:hypothetical protein